MTSGPDYGCACLIDMAELYWNSKKSLGVTRKTFSWQNQINQHHKYDWIEKSLGQNYSLLKMKRKQNEFHLPDNADHLFLQRVHHKIANLSTFWIKEFHSYFVGKNISSLMPFCATNYVNKSACLYALFVN